MNRATRLFLLTPLREGRQIAREYDEHRNVFLLTPLREGRPITSASWSGRKLFLLTPLREGRLFSRFPLRYREHIFLLTPLREGRRDWLRELEVGEVISTHAPAGGATDALREKKRWISVFLLTPLREGRPCNCRKGRSCRRISTHAPAGGATAIFHKSVMRFCGKLPKDDTVLCLASFGFPRRDPKAVYLAWISCANLPQKCVRQGLALKDQGTSCFHEGLASHAFDPVLV